MPSKMAQFEKSMHHVCKKPPQHKTPPPYVEEMQKILETTKEIILPGEQVSDSDAEPSLRLNTGSRNSLSQSVNLAEVHAFLHSLHQDREAREKKEEERSRCVQTQLEKQTEQIQQLTNPVTDMKETLLNKKLTRLLQTALLQELSPGAN
ncbi:hypothetical protein ANN_26369 [Periplaneta americana]|uniref:Uncharacterized protein n=1 Tax=Periplaneta americana TaxID=6978 RepID=A0ABQ8RY12_PERAM|nr:hypothetical protein ANN_26369 [Periplaneta americana]